MRRLFCCIALVTVLLIANVGWAGEPKLAISGYDPVAYFTQSKPVRGLPEHEHEWRAARWRFASAANRDLFIKDPERYAPQFDGYCALGVAGVPIAAPHKDTVDPEAWAIVDGKLYLTHTKASLDRWSENANENIKRAEQHWRFVKDQTEPEIVGPPCRTEPPTVVVTTSDNKRRLIIGRQVSVDASENVVGKGDIRAQLEQVGKNLSQCLSAAGASKADMLFTRTVVSDKDLLLQNAELRTRYIGPEPANSTTIEMSNFAGPDFLIGIEAVAKLD